MMLKKRCLIGKLVLVMVLLGVNTFVFGANLEVEGIIGVDPIGHHTALAVWVEIEPGEAISGISWYNNDEQTNFPVCMAISGEYGNPGLLSAAVVIGEHFSGNESDWSELEFNQPITTSHNGLYVFFKLPTSCEYISTGVGSGLGCFQGVGENNCWLTDDGVSWVSFNPGIQVAMVPVMTTDKGNALDINSMGLSEEIESGSPVQNRGFSVFPNPFNPSTKISFSLEKSSFVCAKVYNARGQLVATLFEDMLSSGRHGFTWHGKDQSDRSVPSGVYLFSLEINNNKYSQRCTLLK